MATDMMTMHANTYHPVLLLVSEQAIGTDVFGVERILDDV